MAPPPKPHFKNWKNSDWSRWNVPENSEKAESAVDGWGEPIDDGDADELILEEVVSPWEDGKINDLGWGEESSEKYKPPHVKALEEQNKSIYNGW